MPPLKRSGGGGVSAIDGGWLRSWGTEGGRDAPLPILLGRDGRAGTGGGGFLEEGNTENRSA